jgi:hypothetical protein
MKYLRRHNLNPQSFLDDTVLQKADGNIEFNPTDNVLINGDLRFGEGFAIPGPTVTNVMYVTLDGDDANDGLGEGPNQAKRTLKGACAVAQQGTTIYVRSGEYYENNPIRVPPKVSIVGDTLRTTIIRPLNGPLTYTISNVERTDGYVTVTTLTSHGLTAADRVRVDCVTFPDIDDTTANVIDAPTPTTFRYKDFGTDITSAPATGTVKKGFDLFHVNSSDYLAQMVFKGLQAPAFCVSIDSDAIVDTSPYVQNCSNINGPWMRNGVEWLPFQTEQPDLNGTMVTGPRPLLDDEIFPASVSTYGINTEGAGGGMLIDGDKYNSQSPLKSMVGDAFTQVSQGGIGFHITNFGYMQLVSCFSVFCSKAFYTTKGGYLSISNSVIDFGDEGFVADGYYPIPYGTGVLNQNYYSTVGSISISEEGAGYTSAPSVTIDPPTTPGGVQATATAAIDPILQKVVSIQVDNPGSGYDFQPTISFSGGGSPTVVAGAVVNLSKNLTIDVYEISNKPQVGSIMFLGNDTTAYYISATGSPSFTFRYDEQKCRRDVGYIVDAVLGDTVFNSNHQSVYAGLSYLRSYSSKVTSLQKAQTIAGIQKAKTEVLADPSVSANATATTRVTSLFNTIVNIINLGVSAAPSISIPFPTTREPGFAEAAALLVANKNFIKDEIEAWIAVNYPTFTYDVATCKRDIEYIIDALAYDLTYQGNGQTRNAALAYAEGSVIAGQIEETQAAYEYWQTIIGRIVKSQAVTPSVGNTTPQVTGTVGSPLDPNEPASTAEALLEYVINVVDHGTGYVPELVILPNYGYGDTTQNTIRNTVFPTISIIQESVIDFLNNAYGGSVEVTTFPPIQSALIGTDVRFHNVSTVSTASTAMEYVGAGVTYNALPFFGGEPVPANERIEINNGKCFTVTSDQIGNYRIGEFFTVNAITGEVTIDAENINLQGLSAIGPFKRNGIPVGVQLREVSDNTSLIASNGLQDVNTAPTQRAVAVYVQNNYLNKVQSAAQTIVGPTTFSADVGIDGGDLYSTAATFNLLNRDGSGSITDDGPTTVNAFLNAGTINIAHTTSTTNINGNLEVKGSIVSTTQASVNLLDTVTTTINAFGAATAINIGAATGSFIVDNQTITFTNATNLNVNGANPTLASTSTGTLTLFDTLITTVNAFRSATSITLGESSGTLTIQSASTVLNGDLQVKGGDITTNQTTFNLLNTTATTVNAFGAATTLNFGAGSGTTTVANNLRVNLNSTLGTDTTSANTFNGTLTANIRDNLTSSLEIKENTNSYFKIDTANSNELTSFGTIAKVAFNNVLDASSTLVASTIFAGGVGIAKKLYVGTDLNVGANVSFGDDRTVDVHSVNGTLSINVPDNTAIAFQVRENTQTYLTAVTTDGSESITIESTPRLLVNNATDNTLGTAASGAAQFIGGVGIAKNATVGVDLRVNRDIVATGDLAVNGGDLTTTAATFNILNTNATTVNFAGAATTLEIGAATGTTNINNNLDVDGDVNIDGGDLTVSTTTFNLANTTATTLNVGGAGVTFNLGTSAGAATTVNIGSSSNSGNTVEINSTAAGIINLTTDVTSGTVNQWQSVTGIINIGSTGTINLGTGSSAITTVDIGGAVTGNILKISSTATGTANLTSDVTSGTVNVFDGTTGTVNIGGQGSTINLGTTGSNSILEVRGSSSSGTATIRTNSGVVTADVFNTVVTTGNLFGAGTTVSIGSATGTTTINNANTVVTGDLAVNGGDVTTSATTFNLLNTTVTTGNLFGAGTAITIGAATGTTTIRNANTVVTGDLAVNGGDITSSATTFNLVNTTATSVNFAGAATALEIGAATGLTRVKNNFEVDGDVTIDGGDLIVSTATFNLANTSATTVNFAGAATTLEIGAATGTTNINNNLDVDGDLNVDGGDLTVSTTTFNIANTTATTVNAFGAATSLVFAATTGTTNIRNNLDVDGDVNVDGGDITTSAGTFNLANTTATIVNAFGAATAITIGFASPTGLTTIRHDLKVDGDLAVDGTLTLGNDVTITGDLAVNGGDLTTTASTFNLINANATTVNFAGAGTTVSIGSTTGTTTIRNANTVITGDLAVNGGDITSSAVTVNILAATSTTVNAFGAATALNLGAATGTTIVRNNFEVDLNTVLNGSLTVDLGATVTGDLAVNGGDITTSATTFNLINANATTVNFAGAATTLEIGAATGTTNINNNLDVDGDVNIDGGDLTVSTATFNLANATATTVNAFGAATTILIGAVTGTTEINNNLQVDLDLDVRGGDITTNQTTFNLINTTATTGNLFGAGTAITIGAVTGTTTIRNANTVVTGDLAVNGADITTTATGTATVFNTNATTVNAFGAGTTVSIGAATGTTTINNANTVVTGDLAVNGGDITTSATTFNLLNSTVTTGNLFGVATGVNVGISAAAASTLTYGPAITGNTFKLAGTAVGTVNYTTDVTSGIVNAWQSVTGTVNLGKSGTINIGNSTTATTAAVVGGVFTGNSLKIASTSAGSVTLNSDVTTGSVNLFNNITTGTLNVAGAGASTINLGSTTSTVNIGVLTLTTDLAVQYGGTGQSSFTTNGVIYGQNASGLAVTAASVPGSNATTSYGVLTTDVSNVPVWTDTIDGGSY